MSLQSFSKYLNPNNLPVEQMSNQNAIGENTGYPMAYMNTPAYAVPRNIPQAQNIIQGGQDVRVDTYSGEEKFADGGGVMGKAMNMGDKLYQFLTGKGEYPGIEKQTMPTAVGKQLYDASGKAMPRYQLNPDGTFTLISEQAPSINQGLSGMNQPASSGSSSGYSSRMAAQQEEMLPTTPAMFGSEQKPWREWTEGEKAQWRRENPGLASLDEGIKTLASNSLLGKLLGGVVSGLDSVFISPDKNAAKYQADLNSLSQLGRMEAQAQAEARNQYVPNLYGDSGTTSTAPASRSIAAPTQSADEWRASMDAWKASQEAAQAAGNQSAAETARLGRSIPTDNRNATQATYNPDGSVNAMNLSGWGGGDGGESTGSKDGGLMHAMAEGGISSLYNLGSYSDGGRLLKGPGDGVSDDIPAVIGDSQPARLADGEFVVPARIVSELGNGSTEAGARKLYAMMDRVQAARKKSIGKGKIAANTKADKNLPA